MNPVTEPSIAARPATVGPSPLPWHALIGNANGTFCEPLWVLSLARSAFYSRTRQVVSLREALSRLGLSKLREVVLQAAMTVRVFRSASYGGCMERLREHCRATAHLARIVSRHTPLSAEQAFLCGLLHDVGIAGILLVLGDTQRGKNPPTLDMLWPAIDAVHATAGARMVRLWGLPPEIATAVEAHHQVRIQGFDHPLGATVCNAEAPTAECDEGLVPAREALAIHDAAFEVLRSEVRAWAASETSPAVR